MLSGLTEGYSGLRGSLPLHHQPSAGGPPPQAKLGEELEYRPLTTSTSPAKAGAQLR